jgi:hypothetical protein
MEEEYPFTVEITLPFEVEQGSHFLLEISQDSFTLEKASLIFAIGGGWDHLDIKPYVEITPPL